MSSLVRITLGILWVLITSAGTVSSYAQSDTIGGNGIAVGYWNDNVLFQGPLNRLFGSGTFPGDDDFQTANFWARYSRAVGTATRNIDIYINIVTSKAYQVRFDLLTTRWLSEVRSDSWEGRYGLGVMLSGNFGGEMIQDAYHWGTGVRQSILPYYRKTLVHLALYGSVRTFFISAQDVSLSGIASASYLTGSGPSYAEGGASLALHPEALPILRARVHTGFVSFYKAPTLYAPMFGTGFLTGYMMSLNVWSESWISLWHTYNQYGRRQKHFGISYSTFPIRIIDDVRFP